MLRAAFRCSRVCGFGPCHGCQPFCRSRRLTAFVAYPMKSHSIGIDFGTTNSSVAFASGVRDVALAQFSHLGELTDAYRSLLYLERIKEGNLNTLKSWSGPEGIEHYLSADPKGRLMQSLKSFLSSKSLLTTEVFGRRYSLEELIARILKDLRKKAAEQFGTGITTAVVGRPVRFVGSISAEDDSYAEKRLRAAFRVAGFESIEFDLEPVAAARYYESTLDHDELILIGDFGGGTSDFSLLHVGPDTQGNGKASARLLGNAGVGLAGDAFDAKIIRHLVAPALGAGSEMRSMDKILPVPGWVYAKLEHWHHLSFLKARDVIELLKGVHAHAVEPEKIAALRHLIKEDLGYRLHQSVQKVKSDLSSRPEATFAFSDGYVQLEAKVTRASFEEWIAEELHQIENCVDSIFKETRTAPHEVDAVFLTGGSSFVPAVRKIFQKRFSAAKLRAGHEFTSVAHGLALKAFSRGE
jgi:hypothetical chaperone protein